MSPPLRLHVTVKEAKSSIQVIERMMSLLDALAGHAVPVNLKQLASQTSLHPSTAHRILGVMVESRLVDRIEPGTYRLGIRLLEQFPEQRDFARLEQLKIAIEKCRQREVQLQQPAAALPAHAVGFAHVRTTRRFVILNA